MNDLQWPITRFYMYLRQAYRADEIVSLMCIKLNITLTLV